MKKLMLIIVLGLMAITALSAHPAANVKAQYDAKTSILTVEYGHKVRDASDHYIFNVMIEVNGKRWSNKTSLPRKAWMEALWCTNWQI